MGARLKPWFFRETVATIGAIEQVRQLDLELIDASRRVIEAHNKRRAADIELRAAMRELARLVGEP